MSEHPIPGASPVLDTASVTGAGARPDAAGPRWRLPGRNVAVKFLLVMAPAVVLVVVAVTTLFTYVQFRDNQRELTARIATTAEVDALALAGPMAEGNAATTRNILHAIAAREEIACAALADEATGLLLVDGSGTGNDAGDCIRMLGQGPRIVVTIRLGERHLGRLALAGDRDMAWAGIRTGLVHAGLLFLTVLAAAMASALFALRTTVMRPLMHLRRSIDRAGEGTGWRLVHWPSHDEVGDFVAVYNRMIRDVEQREAARAESEAGLRAIIEAAPYPIVITRRRDSRIMFINRRTAEVVGLAPEVMIGQYAPNFYVNPDDRARMIQAIAEQGAVLDFELECLAGDGRAFWALMSGAFLSYHGEDAMYVSFLDISDRKEAERRLEQQAQDLAVTAMQLEAERRRAEAARVAAEDANRAKSDFLATMSHELRTPLNAILGFSEILKDRPFGDLHGDRIAEYAGDIHASGVHLLNLINDVLDLAKIEAGKLEIHPVAVDLGTLLASTTRLIAVRAERRGLQLRLEVPAPPLALVADERAVKQIAFNLLSNAIKFTPSGGTVTVRAVTESDGGTAIVVTDTGCGIPADQIERVMRPFEQVHNTYAQSAGGTGLGLTLVQALAELHGGRVDLDSEVDVGTTVTVHLPARPAAPPRLMAVAASA